MSVAGGGWRRWSGRGWALGVLAAVEEVLSERGSRPKWWKCGTEGDVAGGAGVGTGPVRSRGRGWDGERGGKRGAGPFVGAAPGGGMLLAGTACDLLRTFAIPQTLEGRPVICWERRFIRRMCVWR